MDIGVLWTLSCLGLPHGLTVIPQESLLFLHVAPQDPGHPDLGLISLIVPPLSSASPLGLQVPSDHGQLKPNDIFRMAVTCLCII